MSVSNVDEVLGSAEEFVRKNSEEPSRTMNSKECPECEARGTFQGSEEFFLTNSEADPRTTSVSNVASVLGSASEFVRKNSSEPSRTMNSEECPSGFALGTFLGIHRPARLLGILPDKLLSRS